MAEKICLICTLGNRDIQFKKEYRDIIEKKLNDILGKNIITNGKSDTDDLIVNPKGFLESTKIIYDNYDLIKDYMFLPLIEPALNYVHDIKNIILVSTNQTEVNVDENYKKGDTFIEAKIIKKYLSEKGYNVLINEARFNASDLDEWFRHIEKIITDNADFSRLIFEISGGVPTSKEAIRLASLFKKKIEVIEVAKGRANSKNMTFFEERIIKEKIKELIYRHNYTGVLEFSEYLSDDVLKIVNHLNYRLNFDFENAINCYDEDRLKNLINEENTIKKLEYLILELLDNMEIELENGNYANFLARVYRLEEAMGQYIILSFFDDDEIGIIIEYKYQKPRQQSYGYFREHPKKLMSKDYYKKLGLSKILASYFKDLNNKSNKNKAEFYLLDEILENKIHIRNPLDTNNYEYIIPLICNYSFENTKKREKYNKLEKIFKNIVHTYKYNNENLRNSTIVAHGFEGINEYKINNVLSKREIHKPISEFFKDDIRGKFYNIVNKNNKNENKNIFDEIKEAIISNL